MIILTRYIAKHVMTSTVFVFIVVLILSFIMELLGQLRDVGEGEYGFLQAVNYAFLLLPHISYQFFPMIVLLGGVWGLGSLSSNNELIVMRSSGLSVWRMVGAVMMAALLLIILAALIGEWFAPHADYIAHQQKSIAQSQGQAVATESGIWIHEDNNFLHIEQVIERKHLEGVTRYEFDSAHHLLAAYYAKSLFYENQEWVLHDMVKTTITNHEVKSEHIKRGVWALKLTPNLLNVGFVEPEEMSLRRLSDYARYLVQNGLQAAPFQFEFWKRVFQPLTTLVMILLAIPFVFAAPRSVSMGRRILFAVIVGFIFYILNAFLGQFSIVFQVSPFFAALLPTLLFFMIGCMMIMRIKT